MRVIIDTNVLLVSVSDKSSSYWLYKSFQEGKFEIAYTTEILSEYEEQFSKHWSATVATNVLLTLLELPNAIPITIYYQLNLITKDEDDNKFVDCAFAANANYIVTEDSAFAILKTIDFPNIKVLSLQQFKQVLLNSHFIDP